MGMLLTLRPRAPKSSSMPSGNGKGTGEVVLFPGIRYERKPGAGEKPAPAIVRKREG